MKRQFGLGTRWLLTLFLSAGFFCWTAVPRMKAESEADCQKRVERANQLLHIAIDKNGPHSPDAERRRQELHEARERCWNEFHKWWDPDEHRWHDRQDWDDHDHDH